MANTFKNAAKAIGNTATTGVVHAIYISNIHAANDVTVDITVTDTSASATFHLAKNLSVPNGSVAIFEKPINLAATDILKLNASAASSLEAFASILEMT